MFDDFHCLLSSLATLVVRAICSPKIWSSKCKRNWLATNTSMWKVLVNVYSKMLRSQSVETVPCQGTPARVLAALHSLAALFSLVLRALHTKRVCTVDAAQDDQLRVSQRWLTQQTSLECVAMSQFARHAQEREKDWDYNSDIETTD